MDNSTVKTLISYESDLRFALSAVRTFVYQVLYSIQYCTLKLCVHATFQLPNPPAGGVWQLKSCCTRRGFSRKRLEFFRWNRDRWSGSHQYASRDRALRPNIVCIFTITPAFEFGRLSPTSLSVFKSINGFYHQLGAKQDSKSASAEKQVSNKI